MKVILPRQTFVTLFVPKAMATVKSFLLASEYRRQMGLRINPKAIQVKPCKGNHWLVSESLWDNEARENIPHLPSAPIPAEVKQAMIRRWRQGALGLRG